MEIIEFNGWRNNVRMANDEIELIVTKDIGPRIIRLGFIGEKNVFAEIEGEQGGSGENEWMLRGGHRFWVAPEVKPDTYELDNSAVEIQEIEDGVRTIQSPGSITGMQKVMEITLEPKANGVGIRHVLTNKGDKAAKVAPWAATVLAMNGVGIIPLPEKILHSEQVVPNQEWSLWGYTDFSDPRWTLGSRYVLFRQDPQRGPNKLGIAHREGWVAYLVDGYLFVKFFAMKDGVEYPDGGVNFETFSNEQFLELESLGEMVTLGPGETATHEERWQLHRNVSVCKSEEDVDKNVLPLTQGG